MYDIQMCHTAQTKKSHIIMHTIMDEVPREVLRMLGDLTHLSNKSESEVVSFDG